MWSRIFVAGAAALALLVAPAGAGAQQPDRPTTTRVSVTSSGAQAAQRSLLPHISDDGRFVAFVSSAELAPGMAAGFDIYLHDRETGETVRISQSSDGQAGNGLSFAPSVSADGRYVAFQSSATNLVPDDTNGRDDIFVRDRVAGTTERVSVSSTGEQANLGSGAIGGPSISADGRFVAFESFASNLVPGDTNGLADIFVHDRETGTTTLVSASTAGGPSNGFSFHASISGDGSHVAFLSAASNLVPGDTNAAFDAFVRDLSAGTTERVSVSSSGQEGNGPSGAVGPSSISADGSRVAFISAASNLVADDANGAFDVFVRDRVAGETILVSRSTSGVQGASDSTGSSISADGNHVVFVSSAANLVSQDTNGALDVFAHDVEAGTTSRVSVGAGGQEGNAGSLQPAVSGNGRAVAFASDASNLVEGDTNGVTDVFVRQRAFTCLKGQRPNGPVSSVVYDAEPATGPAAPAVRQVNCEVIADAGL